MELKIGMGEGPLPNLPNFPPPGGRGIPFQLPNLPNYPIINFGKNIIFIEIVQFLLSVFIEIVLVEFSYVPNWYNKIQCYTTELNSQYLVLGI